LSTRVLFSSGPGIGHIFPCLPLMRAFRERGDEVALLTAAPLSFAVAGEDVEVLPAGPGPEAAIAEIVRRKDVDIMAGPLSLDVEAELFVGVRVDLGYDESLEAARDWKPDLIVHEHFDVVGPMVAAALGVPVATLAFGPAMASDLAKTMAEMAAGRYSDRDLAPVPPRWYLDTCPPALQVDGWQRPAGRIGLRPETHQAPGRVSDRPGSPERRRPLVLVTFGTIFNSPDVQSPLLRELAALDVDLRVTTGLRSAAEDFDIDPERVTFVGFTPLEELLEGVDLVVTHGGAGTTLGSLAAGIPLVVVPQAADQFVQADRVTAAGAGRAVGRTSSESLADAVTAVLGDPSFRGNAREVAAQIAALPSPADVASRLVAGLRD
jgi:UDP:flavonoid glycosyltransferase YjiC (YdhE family)